MNAIKDVTRLVNALVATVSLGMNNSPMLVQHPVSP